jgi:hypothetical protein
MSEQIPLPARPDAGLPPMPVNAEALTRFAIEMAIQLNEFEQRFVQPRKHPRLSSGHARGANNRPR